MKIKVVKQDGREEYIAALDNTRVAGAARIPRTRALVSEALRLSLARLALLNPTTRTPEDIRRDEALYKNQHLWQVDPTRLVTRRNARAEFDNASNLVKNSASAGFMGASLAASIPRTVAGLVGSVAGENIADRLSNGNGLARVAGGLIGGAAAYGGAGQVRVLPKTKYPSVVRDNQVFKKSPIPAVYTKTSGIPEKINYDPNKFYRTIGRDGVEDIEKNGVIRGLKRYVEAYEDKPIDPTDRNARLIQKKTSNKRIYHDPNSELAHGKNLVEIAPLSEEYVYFGKGQPLKGHGASFYNDPHKGPTTRTPPSEAAKTLARDHIIEVPPDTPMVKAKNLWAGLDKEPVKDWSQVNPEQHLSLYRGQARYDPKTMNTYKLVDEEQLLFVRQNPKEKFDKATYDYYHPKPGLTERILSTPLLDKMLSNKTIGNYKLYPKANPNSRYRNIGNDASGYEDAVRSGQIRNPPLDESKPRWGIGAVSNKEYGEPDWGFKGEFVDPRHYRGKYFVEAKESPLNYRFSRYNTKNWGSHSNKLVETDNPDVTLWLRTMYGKVGGKEILHKKLPKEIEGKPKYTQEEMLSPEDKVPYTKEALDRLKELGLTPAPYKLSITPKYD